MLSWWLSTAQSLAGVNVDFDDGIPNKDTNAVPVLSFALCAILPIPVLLFWLFEYLVQERREVVDIIADDSDEEEDYFASEFVDEYLNTATGEVLFASLEHAVPGLVKARAVAGGLGKVVDLISRHHPGNITMVHPKVKEEGVSYLTREGASEVVSEDQPLIIKVDGQKEKVRVFRYVTYPAGPDGFRATFLLLSHPDFEMRTKEQIYPNPMTRRGVLRFFSLWNQAVGELIALHKPVVYHCPDFHTAVAPWYAIAKHPDLKMVLTLHNAEYQGMISTDMILGDKITQMAKIWNMSERSLCRRLVFHGRFNMLKAAVDFIQERQGGKGVCAVSREYAKECHTQFSLFWGLQVVEGLPNPMLEEDRPEYHEGLDLEQTKLACKVEIQTICKLNSNPDARLFVFMGRMVRQKGVDLLADIAPWLLDTYPLAQLIIVGPVADGYGCYAKEKLDAISKSPAYLGRVFIKCEFWRAPPALKLAADFCLMPSRDEPFGYVDIEFAWCGAALVGAKAGGLGKVPGFYYKAQNRDNLDRLRLELRQVVELAMSATKRELMDMADAAQNCSFPLKRWQQRTVQFYANVVCLAALPMTSSASFARQLSVGDDKKTDVPKRDRVRLSSDMTPSFPSESHSIVQAIAEGQRSFEMPTKNIGEEFLSQELSEEELATRVRDKLITQPHRSIEGILKSVGADQNRERESDKVARWLLKEQWGEPRVHWLVCAGYVASFASSMLTNVVAIYWGFRSSPFGVDALFVVPLDASGKHEVIVPSSWMPMIIASVDSFAFMIGAPMWASLAKRVEPRRLLAVNLLSKPLLMCVILPFEPRSDLALLLIFVEGLINSAALLFVVFNFMMTIEADLSNVAVRMGVLEMLRYAMTWTLSAYIFYADPLVTHSNSWRATFLFLPIGIFVILMTVVPGCLILAAPGPYRDDRFPGWDLGLLFKRKSFIFLTLSEMFGDCGKFASGMFLTWCMTNNWESKELSLFCLLFVMFFILMTGLWTLALKHVSKHGFSFLIGVVLLLAPPTILRAIVLEEVSISYGTTLSNGKYFVLPICAFSLLMEGIRESSVWCAKIRILNSRWRMLSYGTLSLILSHFVCGLSPWICEWILAQPYGASFITTNPKQLSDAVVICLVPIGVFQFIAQVCALPWIHKDMGIPGGAENAGKDKQKKRRNDVCGGFLWRHRFLCGNLAWIFIAGALIYCFFFLYKQVYKPMNYFPPANCHVGKDYSLPDSCKSIWKSSENSDNDVKFEINKYGYYTSARMKCHAMMTEKNGDTFVFKRNACEVLKCGKAPKANAAHYQHLNHRDLPHDEVWSQHCSMSQQNLILVQLFEWRWDDIAEECERYLGPAGYDAVGASPPLEHIQGDSWFLRYQPVSFKFQSRSGGEKEFQNMVDRCAAVGVKVMVDVVLNHMAATWIVNPIRLVNHECGKPSTIPCHGWNGTSFASREFKYGREGVDKFERKHFHHYPTDERSNCGCPPWLNNQVMCDFSGLPDLNTEDQEVRNMLTGLLTHFYERGVTMIRVDAARHVFPESLAEMIKTIPWDYVTLEVYHNVKYSNPVTFDKLAELGTIYDFAYGMMLTQNMIDYWDEDAKEWVGRDDDFKYFLRFGSDYEKVCNGGICETPVPVEKSFVFVDNHDRQRDRYKGLQPSNMCEWNILKHLDNCLINFKFGQQYHVLQAFMLTWPYGDAVRVMSSYAFFTYRQGPPGVRPDSLKDVAIPVYNNETGGDRCRDKPITSPASWSWDEDEERPWICEHRWEGVGGMVRFRKLVMQDRDANKPHLFWDTEPGRIAYSLGDVGFVALSRGRNIHSYKGSNATKDLSTVQSLRTGLPEGTYCNLAHLRYDVKEPDKWKPEDCTCDTVVVNNAGRITHGWLLGGEVVVLHKDYLALDEIPPAPVGPDPKKRAGTFWGWRQYGSEDEFFDKDEIGCCFKVLVNIEGIASRLRTTRETAQDCNATSGNMPGEEREQFGFKHGDCPKTAKDALELIMRSKNRITPGDGDNVTFIDDDLHAPVYWLSTFSVFSCIIVGQLLICCVVLCGRGVNRAAWIFVPANAQTDSFRTISASGTELPLVRPSYSTALHTFGQPIYSVSGTEVPMREPLRDSRLEMVQR